MFQKMNSDRALPVMRALLIASFILFAAVVRIIPHPWNFAPIGAMALFSGAKLGNRWLAFLFPLTALFLGDLSIGFNKLTLMIYLSFCVSVLIGRYIRGRQTILAISAVTLFGAVQFFLVSNFAVWAYGFTPYAKSPVGLLDCFIAGIPLFGNTLTGDAFYATVLFGGFALAERLSPALRATQSSATA